MASKNEASTPTACSSSQVTPSRVARCSFRVNERGEGWYAVPADAPRQHRFVAPIGADVQDALEAAARHLVGDDLAA